MPTDIKYSQSSKEKKRFYEDTRDDAKLCTYKGAKKVFVVVSSRNV